MSVPIYIPRRTSAPIELVLRGQDRTAALACASCGTLFVVPLGGDLAALTAHVRDHCLCYLCGKPHEAGSRQSCPACSKERDERAEAQRFKDATTLTAQAYGAGPVYWSGSTTSSGLGVGVFSSVDELYDYCADERRVVPAYVWACTRRAFSLQADRILEGELEVQEIPEEMVEEALPRTAPILQRLLDAWVKETQIYAWSVDYGRAVLLGEEGR